RVTAFAADVVPHVSEHAARGVAIAALTGCDPLGYSLHDRVFVCHARLASLLRGDRKRSSPCRQPSSTSIHRFTDQPVGGHGCCVRRRLGVARLGPAIGAGGTFQLLAEHRADTAQLTGIRRFTDPDGATRTWE